MTAMIRLNSSIDVLYFENDPFEYCRYLRRVKEFVSEHYSEKISLNTVSRIAGLESSYFSKYFHSKVGVPFSLWLRVFRVKKAITLLNVADYSITEAALLAGFSDICSFERAFQKIMGMTPKEYRNNRRPFTKPKNVAFITKNRQKKPLFDELLLEKL
jgi:AraC-like DNA-binding protein